MNKLIKQTILFFVMTFIVACGIKDSTIQSYKVLNAKNIQTINQNKKNIQSYLSHTNFKKFEKLLAESNISQSISETKAFEDLASSDLIALKKIINKDDSDDNPLAISILKRIKKNINLSSSSSKKPLALIDRLSTLDSNLSHFLSQSNNVANIFSQDLKHIDSIYDKLEVNKYVQEQNLTITEFKNIYKDFYDNGQKIINLNKSLQSEKNLLHFDNNFKEILKLHDKNKSFVSLIEKYNSEVNRSFTKILTGMKESHQVILKSVSWDEDDDWTTEHTRTVFKGFVTPKERDHLILVSDRTLCSVSKFFNADISGEALSFSECKHFIPSPGRALASGDDHAEIYLDDIITTYFNSYKIIENGKESILNNIEVSEEEYFINYPNLNMSVFSKPFGVLEKNAIVTATPIGLDSVGKPSQGEWRQDNSGHSFWYYYGIYSFLNGSNHNHYYRNDYDDYRKNRHNSLGYYGHNNKYGTYSPSSVKKHRPYRSKKSISSRRAAFSKRAASRKSSYSSKRSSSSVRTSKSGSLNKGPGGRGK